MNVSAQSDTQSFIRFGLIADIQYADCEPSTQRFYRKSLQKLDEAVRCFNQQNVQFTINLGDMIDRNFADYDSVLIRLDSLKHRVFNTTGNHDYHGVTDNKILFRKLKMPSEYYVFKEKNWVFIMLNTNEIASYANIAGTKKEKELLSMLNQIKQSGGRQGAEWNGGVSAKQLKWLDAQLKKAEKSGDNVLIFSHHPLYPKSAFTALNNMEILDVIDNYSCVKAVLAGHHHTGGFALYNDIPVVTMEGMVETNDNAFAVVTIYHDKIVITGHGRTTSRELLLP